MMTEPQLIERTGLPYAAIGTRATKAELPALLPQLRRELACWLKLRGMSPAGRCFVRYLIVYPDKSIDLEMGWPVNCAVVGDDRVSTGMLPAGRYAAVLMTGDHAGLGDAHPTLIDWAQENCVELDSWLIGLGEGFSARYETYLVDPAEEADPTKWQTEVVIRLADE